VSLHFGALEKWDYIGKRQWSFMRHDFSISYIGLHSKNMAGFASIIFFCDGVVCCSLITYRVIFFFYENPVLGMFITSCIRGPGPFWQNSHA
jgi:hypothetical protein